jgi:hypothetical protein
LDIQAVLFGLGDFYVTFLGDFYVLWAAVEKWGAENVELWKMDLKGAFNLLDFSAQSAKLLAFELTEGMSVIHITGMFGWTGTPYCFQVVTRVLNDCAEGSFPGTTGGMWTTSWASR